MKIIDIAIKNKKMKCANFTMGCTWVGECNNFLYHLKFECPKEIVNCPNKGCIIKLERENLQNHLFN